MIPTKEFRLNVRSWDTKSWDEQPTRPTRSVPELGSQMFINDDRTLAVYDPALRSFSLHDLLTGESRGTLTRPERATSTVRRLWLVRGGDQLVAMTSDRELEIWDVPTGTLSAVLRGHSPGYFPFYGPMGLDPGTGASMGLWFNRPESLAELLVNAVRGLSPWITRRWPSRKRVPAEVIVWDLATGRPRCVLKDKASPVISPDGRTLATSMPDGTVVLWDLRDAGAGHFR
jgi:WD40 repeat protein